MLPCNRTVASGTFASSGLGEAPPFLWGLTRPEGRRLPSDAPAGIAFHSCRRPERTMVRPSDVAEARGPRSRTWLFART